MATLFTNAELTELLGKEITETRAALVERVVWGWLKPVLGWPERPETIPDDLFAWALQLGAIACENPAGLDAKTIGPFSEQYSEERRLAILDEIARSDLPTGPAAGAHRPAGCFPPARAYPDPAERICW